MQAGAEQQRGLHSTFSATMQAGKRGWGYTPEQTPREGAAIAPLEHFPVC